MKKIDSPPSQCLLIPTDSSSDKESEQEEEILQLKGNKFFKGIDSLEKLFHKHDRYAKRQQQESSGDAMGYEKYNIGSESDPKLVNIGNSCTSVEREQFIQLLHQYFDVLAYSYDDLKYFIPKESMIFPLKLRLLLSSKSKGSIIPRFQVQFS